MKLADEKKIGSFLSYFINRKSIKFNWNLISNSLANISGGHRDDVHESAAAPFTSCWTNTKGERTLSSVPWKFGYIDDWPESWAADKGPIKTFCDTKLCRWETMVGPRGWWLAACMQPYMILDCAVLLWMSIAVRFFDSERHISFIEPNHTWLVHCIASASL